ncbi:MAG: hypothetical protein AAF693_13995 [Bacteroidota bacterium]
MFIDDEPVIAQCFLEDRSKNKNCYLSYEKLIVVISGRISKFELADITQLSFKRKLLLLPLVSGGVLAPFSLIAIFNDVLSLWLLLIMFMSGLLLAYYGLEGRNTLSITTKVKEYDYFIDTPSRNLKAFLGFVLRIRDHKGEPKYYISLPPTLLKRSNAVIELREEVELYETPPKLDSTPVFLIEPLRSGLQVVYQSKSNGEVVPYITGKISMKDLVPFPQERP